MAQTEARITIDRNPKPPDLSKSTAATKMVEAAAATEQMRARRAQIHDQAKRDLSGPGVEPDSPPDPPPVREDIETIEFTAPNGMLIEYGPRRDVSLVDRIARIYSGRDPTIAEFRLTRILMGIRNINGSPPVTVVDEITRTKLANQIGDENIDLLMYYDRVNWPPLQQSELPVLKKRYRT